MLQPSLIFAVEAAADRSGVHLVTCPRVLVLSSPSNIIHSCKCLLNIGMLGLAHECNLHIINVYRIDLECCVRWGILEMKVRKKVKKNVISIFFKFSDLLNFVFLMLALNTYFLKYKSIESIYFMLSKHAN